ncbi:MAG: FtsH protease activity modulator HflK [Pseudomonadota bacterium]
MPWHDNSGNGDSPKGNSNSNDGPTRGPWGQPPNQGSGNNGAGGPRRPGRGGNDGPDLDELLEVSRQRLKRAFPRRGGGNGAGGGGDLKLTGPMIAGGVVLLIGFWAFTGIFQVEAQSQAVMTTFGQYSGIRGPGLHWHAPIIQRHFDVATQSQQSIEIPSGQGENLMLTSDRAIVDIGFGVDWKVSEAPTEIGELPNAAKYVFNIENPRGMVKAVAEAAMRETIGGNELEPIITSGQAALVTQTRESMQAALDEYDSGIEVLRVNITTRQAPAKVRDAFVDVIKARNDRDRVINEAERDANRIIPVAEGEAQRILQEAQAYAAEVTNDALGQATRFNEIYAEYLKAPEVTRNRMYLETVEEVLGQMNKIVVDEGAGNGIVPYLPLDTLTKKSND